MLEERSPKIVDVRGVETAPFLSEAWKGGEAGSTPQIDHVRAGVILASFGVQTKTRPPLDRPSATHRALPSLPECGTLLYVMQ